MLTLTHGGNGDVQKSLASAGCRHHFLITSDQTEMQTDQLYFLIKRREGSVVAANCDFVAQCW